MEVFAYGITKVLTHPCSPWLNNSESESHRLLTFGKELWGSPSLTLLLKAQSTRPGCPGPCPVRFWLYPSTETLQSFWETYSSI